MTGNRKISKPIGFKRIVKALGYSLNGLKVCYQYEQAFRQEMLLLLIVIPLCIVDIGTFAKVMLFCSWLLVLGFELLNTAIEVLTDMVSPEINHMAKKAKDLASAAVLISLALFVIICLYCIYIIAI